MKVNLGEILKHKNNITRAKLHLFDIETTNKKPMLHFRREFICQNQRWTFDAEFLNVLMPNCQRFIHWECFTKDGCKGLEVSIILLTHLLQHPHIIMFTFIWIPNYQNVFKRKIKNRKKINILYNEKTLVNNFFTGNSHVSKNVTKVS